MRARKGLWKKLTRMERKLEREQKHLVRDRSEEEAALEEVFDKPTLMTIYSLINRGVIDRMYGAVKSGKEAKIYWALGPKGEELAVKIYLTVTAEFKRGILPYIKGDVRFKHVKGGTRVLIYAWAEKEFKNLTLAHQANVRVPKPYAVRNNVLVAEFIGEKGVPAPLLKEVELENPEETYLELLEAVRLLYRKAELVHGDLSEYNVMVFREEPIIFDLSQAVLLSHPLAHKFLRRDLKNLNRYFGKLGVKVKPEAEAYRWIVGG
ncbi:TPA: serine protein kinase RIO [Candidatus Bathyarchaeota archaeon]|nr:serine protein kinase RIO [Candidatus Bathyarchaeota archaeon]